MPTIVTFVLTFFAALAAIGFVISLVVHTITSFGKMPPNPQGIFVLFLGIFATWVPAVIASQKVSRHYKAKDQMQASLRGCPVWMRKMMYGLGYYALASFGVFMIWLEPAISGESGDSGFSPEFIWMASAYGMAFYAAAFSLLYSATHAKDAFRKCLNGHNMYELAKFCEECGAPPRVYDEISS